MKFVSTRGKTPPVDFSTAIVRGLAPDGGLYVPAEFPVYSPQRFAGLDQWPDIATAFLEPFLEGDALASQLPAICNRAFDFPLPLFELRRGTSLLELFHGPTAAFKDFGARFLSECFAAIVSGPGGAGSDRMTILVATSGDTGGAVAAAFHRKRGIEIGVLFPRDGVSPRQRKQLTCWDDNVRSFAVRGVFDDCQRVVKQAFMDDDWRTTAGLTSANSINVGRLLPQAAYYAASSLFYQRKHGRAPGFVIPSGNLGNAVGAFWAKRVGFPIRRIALATNANRTVPDWFDDGAWNPRPSIPTLANAMDVGDPSNMERLFDLYPRRDDFLHDAEALAVDDGTIRQEIAAGPERWGRVWCPHTATAVHLRDRLDTDDWVIVATAHPAKFDSIVEPLVGRSVDTPAALTRLLTREERVTEIDPDPEQLRRGMGT